MNIEIDFNEINNLEKDIKDINNIIIQKQGQIDLLQQQQQASFQKLGISTEEELIQLKEKNYQQLTAEIQNAKDYLTKAKAHIENLNNILAG